MLVRPERRGPDALAVLIGDGGNWLPYAAQDHLTPPPAAGGVRVVDYSVVDTSASHTRSQPSRRPLTSGSSRRPCEGVAPCRRKGCRGRGLPGPSALARSK